MKINKLALKQFRNANHVQFEFDSHLNIFVGDNGQGKTNILESIVYLSSGRSFRVNQDSYLIQDGQDFSVIEAKLENDDDLRIVLSEKGKYLTHNQKVIEKLSDFIGLCNVVLFHPDDLQFFTQSPKKRRREIDYELGKNSHQYLTQLSEVNHLISDRNAFLKSDTNDDVYLEVIDSQLVELSVSIIKQRKLFVEHLSKNTNLYFKKLVDDYSEITMEYQAPIDLEQENYLEAFKKRMSDNLRRDKEFKQTHVGIHRDDYVFKIDSVPIINVLSQGQRRLLMIAFKLAIIDWLIKENDIYPIFCMDDLFSELDQEKRRLVLSLLDPKLQVFITTTDLKFIETNKDKIVFNIRKGEGGINS
ncbi:MAG TPA: DNA replication and repair protein RecF [Erysipelothrix sp.]|nr:DNA replication and repair protein RecF [Erysipelothrix sp.]